LPAILCGDRAANPGLGASQGVERHAVRIRDLETDGTCQDLMLSVHHATLITFAGTPAIKVIENHRGRAWVKQQQQIQFALPMPGMPGMPIPLGPQPPGPPVQPSP
jgi:hypothetical protein